jgi:hypothetical protein
MSRYDHRPRLQDRFLTRRELLARMGNGFAALGLAGVLGAEGLLGAAPAEARRRGPPRSARLHRKKPHFPAKAKRVIFLFMNGGPSHVDTFDPKPALAKYAGKLLPMENPATERKTGAALPSPYQFAKHGRSGIEVSEIFPHVASCVDDLAIIRSMHADVPEPRAVADADELRRGAAAPPQPRLVGDLRPGHREPEPARLHRDVPRRLPDPGDAELAGRLPARRARRAPTSTRGRPTSRSSSRTSAAPRRPREQRAQLDLLQR